METLEHVHLESRCKCETLFYSEVSFLWCQLGKQRDESKTDTLAAVQKVTDLSVVGVKEPIIASLTEKSVTPSHALQTPKSNHRLY